jgi:hypothetical protein
MIATGFSPIGGCSADDESRSCGNTQPQTATIDQRAAAASMADCPLALHRCFEKYIIDRDISIWLQSFLSQSGDELRNLNN